MSDNPANAEPSAPLEIAPGNRLSTGAGAGDDGPDHAPPVEVTGEHLVDSERRGLIALFSVGVALSILVHAAFLGAGLLHLPLNGPANEEALPVTVVPDAAQPETQAKPPSPQPPAAAAESKPPAAETPVPKEASKPAPEAPQEKAASPPPPAAETPPGSAAPASPAPASAAPLPAPPPVNAGPGEGVVADKLAEGMAAELSAAIKRCWTVPPGWTNPHQVTVVMAVHLDRNGALATRPVLLEFSASEVGMAAAKNALAAVARCAPYKLPPDKYSQWRETQVRLAPE